MRDLLRRILQIGIQGNDVIAPRLREACHDGHVLPDIARQHHHAGRIGTTGKLLAQYRDGAVGAAIIDEDDLIGPSQLVQHRVQPVKQMLQTALLVEYRNDDGKRTAHRHDSRMIFVAVSTTRSTSLSSMVGNNGKVTVSRPMRSAFGN